jgi:hypothetical protein
MKQGVTDDTETCGLLVLIASTCQGQAIQTAGVTITEPGRATLESYGKRADIVALVKVVAGDTEAYEKPVYRAEVLQGFKGAIAGQTIFFGRFVGTRLGSEYVVFLRAVKEPIAPKSAANASYGDPLWRSIQRGL